MRYYVRSKSPEHAFCSTPIYQKISGFNLKLGFRVLAAVDLRGYNLILHNSIAGKCMRRKGLLRNRLRASPWNRIVFFTGDFAEPKL